MEPARQAQDCHGGSRLSGTFRRQAVLKSGAYLGIDRRGHSANALEASQILASPQPECREGHPNAYSANTAAHRNTGPMAECFDRCGHGARPQWFGLRRVEVAASHLGHCRQHGAGVLVQSGRFGTSAQAPCSTMRPARITRRRGQILPFALTPCSFQNTGSRRRGQVLHFALTPAHCESNFPVRFTTLLREATGAN